MRYKETRRANQYGWATPHVDETFRPPYMIKTIRGVIQLSSRWYSCTESIIITDVPYGQRGDGAEILTFPLDFWGSCDYVFVSVCQRMPACAVRVCQRSLAPQTTIQRAALISVCTAVITAISEAARVCLGYLSGTRYPTGFSLSPTSAFNSLLPVPLLLLHYLHFFIYCSSLGSRLIRIRAPRHQQHSNFSWFSLNSTWYF